MKEADFAALAEKYAREAGLEALLPVIEKEMLHLSIIDALDEAGILQYATFQGGTCLRLCYGATRYSEDLDFACGDNFERIEPGDVEKLLKRKLGTTYGLEATMKHHGATAFADGSEIRRWWIVVNTSPARPDLPSQRIKVEFASIPSYTREIRFLNVNYHGMPGGYEAIAVPCQSASEILADKLVSLPNTDASKYVRYRDLWDINWIITSGKGATCDIAGMAERKHADYRCRCGFNELMAEGARRADLVYGKEFRAQMSRFLPPDVMRRTIEKNGFLDAMRNEIASAFRSAAAPKEPAVPEPKKESEKPVKLQDDAKTVEATAAARRRAGETKSRTPRKR